MMRVHSSTQLGGVNSPSANFYVAPPQLHFSLLSIHNHVDSRTAWLAGQKRMATNQSDREGIFDASTLDSR